MEIALEGGLAAELAKQGDLGNGLGELEIQGARQVLAELQLVLGLDESLERLGTALVESADSGNFPNFRNSGNLDLFQNTCCRGIIEKKIIKIIIKKIPIFFFSGQN